MIGLRTTPELHRVLTVGEPLCQRNLVNTGLDIELGGDAVHDQLEEVSVRRVERHLGARAGEARNEASA